MPVTLINRLSIKPGMIDEFIEAQRKFTLSAPAGVLGGRMYRSRDGSSRGLVNYMQRKIQ